MTDCHAIGRPQNQSSSRTMWCSTPAVPDDRYSQTSPISDASRRSVAVRVAKFPSFPPSLGRSGDRLQVRMNAPKDQQAVVKSSAAFSGRASRPGSRKIQRQKGFAVCLYAVAVMWEGFVLVVVVVVVGIVRDRSPPSSVLLRWMLVVVVLLMRMRGPRKKSRQSGERQQGQRPTTGCSSSCTMVVGGFPLSRAINAMQSRRCHNKQSQRCSNLGHSLIAKCFQGTARGAVRTVLKKKREMQTRDGDERASEKDTQ